MSGRGQVVDVTMLGSVLSFLTEAVTSTIETGEELEPNTRQRRAQAYGCVDSQGWPSWCTCPCPTSSGTR